MTDDDRLIEVQGTAEHGAFTRQQMDQMVDLAAAGIRQLFAIQRTAIEAPRSGVTRLLIATTNRGKQDEFRRLLADLARGPGRAPGDVGLDLEVDEPHETYAENAIAKADAYARASGLVSLADDSGIEIAALDWGPGVRSARWGGGRNAERVLEALGDEPRPACAHGLRAGRGRPRAARPGVEVFTGVVEGSVATGTRGTGGFGYDPIFELPSRPDHRGAGRSRRRTASATVDARWLRRCRACGSCSSSAARSVE